MKHSDKVHLITAEDTWMEGAAIDQLHQLAELPDVRCVVGLPDLHPGQRYPIGASCLTQSLIYPALVGNDIGCGMALWQSDTDARKLKLDKLNKSLRTGAMADQGYWSGLGMARLEQALAGLNLGNVDLAPHRHSLGTIGGGNHFAELQAISRIVDEPGCERLGLESSRACLLVHSGSRGLGEAILRRHVDAHKHQGVAADSAAGQAYLNAHAIALHWARINRQLIAERIADCLGWDLQLVMDINHNCVHEMTLAGGAGWLHRKGTTPADAGPVMIPGSRGALSYLVQPLDCAASLHSLAHGAGRKWARGDCQGRLAPRYSVQALEKTKLGSWVICDDKALVYEEAPEAYKPIDQVMGALLAAGLIQPLAEFRPLLTYKVAT